MADLAGEPLALNSQSSARTPRARTGRGCVSGIGIFGPDLELCEIFFVSLGLNLGVERLEFDPDLPGDNLLLPLYDWRTIRSSHDAHFELQPRRHRLVVIERNPARLPIHFITTIPRLRRDRCANRLSHLF